MRDRIDYDDEMGQIAPRWLMYAAHVLIKVVACRRSHRPCRDHPNICRRCGEYLDGDGGAA